MVVSIRKPRLAQYFRSLSAIQCAPSLVDRLGAASTFASDIDQIAPHKVGDAEIVGNRRPGNRPGSCGDRGG